MIFLPDNFEIDLDGQKLQIHMHTMRERKVFEIQFLDGKKNLMITRPLIFDGKKLWMPVPEGRQEEALSIGAKIVEHFKNLKTQ